MTKKVDYTKKDVFLLVAMKAIIDYFVDNNIDFQLNELFEIKVLLIKWHDMRMNTVIINGHKFTYKSTL